MSLWLQLIDFLSLFHNFLWMFKNVVHSLEPGETPSNLASHQAPNYVKRSKISQKTLKRCVAVAVRLRCVIPTLNAVV